MPKSEYRYTSESFALGGVRRYWDYWSNRISNTDPAHSRWSGYCSIYFTDEDADGREDSSEVARVSGKVDAMRLPKEIYFAHRVIQSEQPDLHILGHWSYPASQPDGTKTAKTIYVIANTESVELLLNGKSLGVNAKPDSGWIFSFPAVEFAPGSLKATGKNGGKVVAQQELVTAGAPAAIKLTPIVSPKGLQADGGDVALIDFEVVDAKGNRCPTDDARVDFTSEGPGIWRGGYNSGKIDSTNNTYLNTELGINRVAVRSTMTPGTITVTAKRDGPEARNAADHVEARHRYGRPPRPSWRRKYRSCGELDRRLQRKGGALIHADLEPHQDSVIHRFPVVAWPAASLHKPKPGIKDNSSGAGSAYLQHNLRHTPRAAPVDHRRAQRPANSAAPGISVYHNALQLAASLIRRNEPAQRQSPQAHRRVGDDQGSDWRQRRPGSPSTPPQASAVHIQWRGPERGSRRCPRTAQTEVQTSSNGGPRRMYRGNRLGEDFRVGAAQVVRVDGRHVVEVPGLNAAQDQWPRIFSRRLRNELWSQRRHGLRDRCLAGDNRRLRAKSVPAARTCSRSTSASRTRSPPLYSPR